MPADVVEHTVAKKLKLNGEYYDKVLKQNVKYKVAGVYGGFGMMYAAGVISGLLVFLISGKRGYSGNYFPTTSSEIFSGLIALKLYAVILTGLIILVLTPVFRVGLSILVFIKEKDFLYVKITSLVFIILLISFILGKVE